MFFVRWPCSQSFFCQGEEEVCRSEAPKEGEDYIQSDGQYCLSYPKNCSLLLSEH